MKVPIMGDIHGKWLRANAIVNHEAGDGFALSTGDLGNYNYTPAHGQKLIFCHGNHESYTYIQELMNGRTPNQLLVPLRPGEVYTLPDGTTIAAFPGVYSPHFFESGGPIKYYTKQDVAKLLAVETPVDILLSHEAPVGAGVRGSDGVDRGREDVNSVMDHIQPSLLIFGHHHASYDTTIGRTRVIGLDQPHRSYAVVDTEKKEIEQVKATLETIGHRQEYKYPWEKGGRIV